MLSEWAIEKLEAVKDCERVQLRDSLRLLPETDGLIHKFALENRFTVLVASTNLVFRELYEKAVENGGVTKLLLLDRTPFRRRLPQTVMRAPPPFYPDFLDGVPIRARIDLSLRWFLVEKTGDPNWPADADEPHYARLIVQHLSAVLQSHRNLRTADPSRFSDSDFRVIVGLVGIRRPVRVTGLFYKKPTKAQVYPRSDRNTVKEGVRIERRRRPHDSLRQSSTKRGPVEEQKLGDPTILHGLLI